MRRMPQYWQEGLKDGKERLGVEEEAPTLAGWLKDRRHRLKDKQ